jgi:hypothetical protein
MTDPQYNEGMVILDAAVVFLMSLAAILNLAVLRDQRIVEPLAVAAGRRVMVGGLVILAIRYGYLFYQKGDLPIGFPTGAGLCMIGLGASVIAGTRLVRQWHKSHPVAQCDRRCGCADRRKANRAEDPECDTDWNSL